MNKKKPVTGSGPDPQSIPFGLVSLILVELYCITPDTVLLNIFVIYAGKRATNVISLLL